jgi:uncharacterized protein YegP (UPF0339 family)
MKFVVDNGRGAHPTWRLYAGDDMVAWAGETFSNTMSADRAARAFLTGADSARYEAYQRDGSQWRWRAWRSSTTVAYSGQRFACKLDAENAAEVVRRHTESATAP